MKRTIIWLKEVEEAGQLTFLPPPFNILEILVLPISMMMKYGNWGNEESEKGNKG